MAKLVEVDERASIFTQMEEDVSPVILIEKISVDPEESDSVSKGMGWVRPRSLRSSRGSFRHNYTEVSVGVAPS